MLTISGNTTLNSAIAVDEICHTLDNDGISLRGISTPNFTDPLLLNFLSSHPGFREIRLEPISSIDDELMDRIFEQILPVQRKTLEVFVITESMFDKRKHRPSDRHLNEVSKCHQLRTLHVPYAASEEEILQNKTAATVWVYLLLFLNQSI
jgi:hypothetical protein